MANLQMTLDAHRITALFGDEIGPEPHWDVVLKVLWADPSRRAEILTLMMDVMQNGFQQPIIIDQHGCVRDGAQRIAVGLALQVKVPVEFRFIDPSPRSSIDAPAGRAENDLTVPQIFPPANFLPRAQW